MNPLAVAKLATIVTVIATLFGAGWWVNGTRWEPKYNLLNSEYVMFKARIMSEGKLAKADADTKFAAYKSRQERANAENKLTIATQRADIERLRRATPDPVSRDLPPAPAGTSRPDLICLDRATYQREDGEVVARLFAGARSLADEGTAATIDLNTARQWAQGETK